MIGLMSKFETIMSSVSGSTASCLRLAGLWLGFRVVFLFVVADHGFQRANRKDGTFLAADGKGNGTKGHGIAPRFKVAESRISKLI